MTDRHPDDDLLIDLALSSIDEPQRGALTSHLALCEPCRARYATIADSVDHVLAAAPPVAPPAGFSQSVLAAMGIADDRPRALHDASRGVSPATAPSPDPSPSSSPEPGARIGSAPATPGPAAGTRSGRRAGRRAWLAGMAAVLALLVGAVGAAVLLGRAPEEPAAEVAAVGPPLVTGDGTRVGTVLDSWYEGEPVLVVTISQGPVGVHYECQLVLADGTRQAGGSWVLDEASGVTWVIEHPDDEDVTRLELVTDSGRTWATATL